MESWSCGRGDAWKGQSTQGVDGSGRQKREENIDLTRCNFFLPIRKLFRLIARTPIIAALGCGSCQRCLSEGETLVCMYICTYIYVYTPRYLYSVIDTVDTLLYDKYLNIAQWVFTPVLYPTVSAVMPL